MRSMKNVAVFTEDGAFALFFRPHLGGFDSSRVPTPGNSPSKAKKMLMPGVSPGGGGRWAQLELTDASSLYIFMRLGTTSVSIVLRKSVRVFIRFLMKKEKVKMTQKT